MTYIIFNPCAVGVLKRSTYITAIHLLELNTKQGFGLGCLTNKWPKSEELANWTSFKEALLGVDPDGRHNSERRHEEAEMMADDEMLPRKREITTATKKKQNRQRHLFLLSGL